jgi:hypothetical protein
MKRLAVCILNSSLACFVATSFCKMCKAQDRLRIVEVGLDNYYSRVLPTPVRVHIPSPEHDQTVQLEFTLQSSSQFFQRLSRIDHLMKQVQLRAGEAVDMEVPMLVPASEGSVLDVVETDSAGRKIDSTSEILNSLIPVYSGNQLVAIYCNDWEECRNAQSQISEAGITEGRPITNRQFMYAFLREPLQNWWDYGAANAVVLAGKLADRAPGQLKALEYYVRSGGTLVLMEKEADDPAFLIAYRQTTISSDPIIVGAGYLYRVPSISSEQLGLVFDNNVLKKVTAAIDSLRAPFTLPLPESLLDQVRVPFSFPRLRWLILWFAMYILVVGLVNFTVLQQLGKLEWGWVTIGGIALLFAGGLYAYGSSARPKNYTIDDVLVYRMDEHSPVALADLALRISSRERRSLVVAASNDFILYESQSSSRGLTSDATGTDISADILGKSRIRTGWQVRIGPPLLIELPMLRWSFRDVYLEGFREFGGSVHWTAKMVLKNDTGQRFSEAIYIDYRANKKYTIPSLAPGESYDLADKPAEVIYDSATKPGTVPTQPWRFASQPTNGPFALGKIPYWAFFNSWNVFIGANEDAGPNARLLEVPFDRRPLALTVVSLDAP